MKISERTLAMLFNVLAETNRRGILERVYRESGGTGKKAYQYSGVTARKIIDDMDESESSGEEE